MHELKELINSKNDNFALIDVRTPKETKISHIDRAKLIPLNNIHESKNIAFLREISLDHNIYIICKRGGRSLKAIQELRRYGITAKNVNGGMDAWQKEEDQ